MRTLKSLLLVVLFAPNFLLSQEVRIQGSVADSLSLEPLPFATIQVLDQTNQMVFGTIADSLGIFDLPNVKVSAGCKLVVSFMATTKRKFP